MMPSAFSKTARRIELRHVTGQTERDIVICCNDAQMQLQGMLTIQHLKILKQKIQRLTSRNIHLWILLFYTFLTLYWAVIPFGIIVWQHHLFFLRRGAGFPGPLYRSTTVDDLNGAVIIAFNSQSNSYCHVNTEFISLFSDARGESHKIF